MATTVRYPTLALFAALCLTLLGLAVTPSVASAVEVVIDDFEDGDTSDWGFFGGNNAGGGGGPASDRPQEGSFYFSTGWGGEGSASGFYGGAFKNFNNGAQVVPPADPVLNVWLYNQSDATADAYTLEITLREDTNGDGWVNGTEDSVRTDVSLESCQFNDTWTLVSVPVSAFVNLGTGGNGIFDGNLDEIVIVIAGVEGASGSTVEVDFDRFFFSDGGAPLTGGYAPCEAGVVFDDMEHGNPFGNGWFVFGGSVGGGGVGPNGADLPPENGGAFSLETGWGSGGVPGLFGGFGRNNPTDTGATGYFNFWINPDAGQDYTLEINLQDDDNGDDAIPVPNDGADDEFQYNCVVSPSGPCAVSGGGWQLVSIPLADFFDDNSFLTGGNGVLDPISVANGGNGQLINVVWAVISNSGADASFRTDYWVFSEAPLGEPTQVIDDFESGLPFGLEGSTPIGFYTFQGAGTAVGITTTDLLPAPRPGAAAGNNALAMTVDSTSFAGFIHAFENDALDTWVTQDWSGFVGLRVWVYGQGSGTDMFIDVLDNRNPGSTVDDAERFTVTFVDDFVGWQQLEFPFESFARKEIGNGAPNDGFTLTAVHGWAVGTLDTGGEKIWFIDQAELFGVAEIPELTLSFGAGGFSVEEGGTAQITAKLNRALNDDDPDQVSVDFFTTPGTAVPGKDYTDTAGTLTFVKGGATELGFDIQTFDNSKWEGGRSILVTLTNPAGAVISSAPVVSTFILENDEFDPLLQDDFETFPYLWSSSGNVSLSSLIVNAGEGNPLERPGQDPSEGILQITGPLPIEVDVQNHWCNNNKLKKQIVAAILTTDSFDALTVDHTTVTFGDAFERHVDKKTGLPRRHEDDVDGDGDTDLVFHFLTEAAGVDCDTDDVPLNGLTFDGQAVTAGRSGASFGVDFSAAKDWSAGEALSFWFYGSGNGAEVKVTLKDNRAPDPGPSGWSLVWADEFNDPAGTTPNPDNWSYEIGDGTVNGIPGWGNSELQYYTDDPANASTDGAGNLLITLAEADGSLLCYYGPCEYTSARLISQRKAEFAYGRIEARILVPDGEAGLWPAFWSLGTDIGLVQWPQTGEIDIMEYVSRLSNEIFGSIHGPGYSGGQAFAGILDFGEPVYNDYHTFRIEWQPNLIVWYVDGIEYHRAEPANVAPNEWVFNDAIFLLLNMAVGGNFGGPLDPGLTFPQTMAVDYVRVYQGPDSAERFETSFVDDVEGWRQVEVPFSAFVRSAEQPAGAPDDGLGLSEVWGYGFALPDGGTVYIDEVKVKEPPPPTAITVTNLANSGDGSLREALATIASGGTITFDPALAGGVINLVGSLVPPVDVVIDAAGAAPITLDGGGVDRVLLVNAGVAVEVNDMVITNGFGFQVGGGIINNGSLTLNRSTVTGNTMTTDAGDFWQGGGGIYNGEGSSLTLIDSTVSDNFSGWTGGGVYSFFNSTTVIERSTISGNLAADVGGGLRLLGNAEVVNSTISGNQSTGWYGGALFLTDGVMNMTNTTVTDNVSPSFAPAAVFVGTFTDASATLNVGNSIIANNVMEGCFLAPFGAGVVAINSLGGNVYSDASCNPGAGDQFFVDPLLSPLADNGGPTQTHALLAGSPAVDAADNALCPATDQRGVARPQGAACDSGAYEQ